MNPRKRCSASAAALAGLAWLSAVGADVAAPADAARIGASPSQEGLLGAFQHQKHARNYSRRKSRGTLRVLNLPDEERFAAVWQPEGYASSRILVLLPGTSGLCRRS